MKKTLFAMALAALPAPAATPMMEEVTLADFGGHEWTADSKIIAAIAGPAFLPAGNIYSVSGMSISTAPEPATATLSLLALAGLAARRKRH
ncbi:MAG: PEP-CTERM sorting domain-containing protein [Akkermansia sp.]|nr:PEP-CTERM sorting domain-containing protein [Akkermansia sp.]